MLPQQKLTNYFFRNKGDQSFEDVSTQWTNATPTFSNGAAYADLDNDGDLEIIVNNINSPATVLKNNTRELQEKKYLQVQLEGPPGNPNGVGALVELLLDNGSKQVRQQISARGFLSTVSPTLHFGLGKDNTVKQLVVKWPDGRIQLLSDVGPNQVLQLDYSQATEGGTDPDDNTSDKLFSSLPAPFYHEDPPFNDYSKQILLPHKLSQTGPAAAKADVNGDGLEDVFLGGGRGQEGQLWIGTRGGNWKKGSASTFTRDRNKEDVGACFLTRTRMETRIYMW